MRTTDAFDLRAPHPLEPITKTVTITRALAAADGDSMTVTVVPVVPHPEGARTDDVLASPGSGSPPTPSLAGWCGSATLRRDDAEALTRLALASKAHWGYSEEFMARCVAELTLTPTAAPRGRVRVGEHDDGVVGFHGLTGEPPEVELDLLYVDPGRLRQGIGGLLLHDAVATARATARRRCASRPTRTPRRSTCTPARCAPARCRAGRSGAGRCRCSRWPSGEAQPRRYVSTASTRRWSSGVSSSPSLVKMLRTWPSTTSARARGARRCRVGAALRHQPEHLPLARVRSSSGARARGAPPAARPPRGR